MTRIFRLRGQSVGCIFPFFGWLNGNAARWMRAAAGGAIAMTILAVGANPARAQQSGSSPARTNKLEPSPIPSSRDFIHGEVIELNTREGALRIEFSGDSVTAFLNETPLPKERLRISDDFIEVLDQSGEPLTSTIVSGREQADGLMVFAPASPGKPARPRRTIGVVLSPGASSSVAPGGAVSHEGMVITAVLPGQPAALAGIKPFDVLSSVDGVPVTEIDSLRRVMDAKQPGEALEVVVLRAGAPVRLSLQPVESSPAASGAGGTRGSALEQEENVFIMSSGGAPIGPDIQRELRGWLERNRVLQLQKVEAELRRLQLEHMPKSVEMKLQFSVAELAEIQDRMEDAMNSMRQMHMAMDLPEVSFVGTGTNPVAVFTSATARGGGGTGRLPAPADAAPVANVANEIRTRSIESRLDAIEVHLARLESLLTQLVERQSRPAPSTEPPAAPAESSAPPASDQSPGTRPGQS